MAKILIVEDELIQAAALEFAVIRSGHEHLSAHTIPQALQILAGATPDAALVDLLLRGVDAGPVIEALSKCKVPLAVLTGPGRDVDERFREHLVIHKPADDETVAGAIDFLLGQRPHADR